MRIALIGLAFLPFCACTGPTISSGRIGGIWATPDRAGVTFTTADVRMISERQAPWEPNRKIVCTEPAPDIAKAISTATEGSASGSGSGSVNVTLSGSVQSSAALLELAGRTTALLALRDGLFHACEGYANGVIGPAAYALILSRYGQVLVTLFLSQDIQNAAMPATNTVQAPAVSLNGSANSTPKDQTSTPEQKQTNKVTSSTNTANVGRAMLASASGRYPTITAYSPDRVAPAYAATLIPVAELTPPGHPPDVATPGPAKPAKPSIAKSPSPTPGDTPAQSASGAGLSGPAAAAILALGETFLKLRLDDGAREVVCLNYLDLKSYQNPPIKLSENFAMDDICRSVLKSGQR